MERSTKRQRSEDGNSGVNNPRTRPWGDLEDEACSHVPPNLVSHRNNLVRNRDQAQADSILQKDSDLVQIKDLNRPRNCPMMTVEVLSIHPGGSKMTTASGRHYLPFTIGDKTGTMKAIAWEEVAIPLSDVLDVGQTIKIINGVVEKTRNTSGVHHISLSRGCQVEVYKENGEICSIDPRRPQVSVRSIIKTHPAGPRAKRLCVEAKKKSTIGELTCVTHCKWIELQVQTMLTEGVVMSGTGVHYLRFIGTDGTGEICCTIFEPHSRRVGDSIKEGVCVKLENVKVNRVNPSFSTFCENDFEINVYRESRIEMLKQNPEKSAAPAEESPAQVEAKKIGDSRGKGISPTQETVNPPPAVAAAQASSTMMPMRKIVELETGLRSICLEVQVVLIIPSSYNSDKQSIRFIASDDTGEICCSVFQPHYATIAPVIQEGVYLQLEKPAVTMIDESHHKLCDNDLQINIWKCSGIKLLERVEAAPQPPSEVKPPPLDEEPVVTPAEPPLKQVKEEQILEVKPVVGFDEELTAATAEASREPSETIEQMTIQINEAMPDIVQLPAMGMTVADLLKQNPGDCKREHLELEVKWLETPGVLTNRLGTSYICFVGQGDIGEIHCTITNPCELVGDIGVGSLMSMTTGLVERVAPSRPKLCASDFEIHLDNRKDEIDILRGPSGKGDRSVVVDSLVQLKKQHPYTYVDFLAVLKRFEEFERFYGATDIKPRRKLIVTDYSWVEIPVIFTDGDLDDPSLAPNTIIECCNLRVKKIWDDGKWEIELHFIPGRSTIIRNTDKIVDDGSSSDSDSQNPLNVRQEG